VPLGERVAEEQERARKESDTIESEDTRAALDRLTYEVSRLITEELLEIEAEDLPPGEGEGEPPLLVIVPEQVFAYMGEKRTLTVAARRQGIPSATRLQSRSIRAAWLSF